MIYFDNSATTCVDAEVADRAVEIMCRQFGNPSSLHGVGSSAYTELGIARNQIAKMIAARTGDIYFTSVSYTHLPLIQNFLPSNIAKHVPHLSISQNRRFFLDKCQIPAFSFCAFRQNKS